MIGWIILIIVYYIGFSISFFIGTNQQHEIDESNYKRTIKECYISKNKVRDKIEELKNTHNGDDFNLTNVIMILQYHYF